MNENQHPESCTCMECETDAQLMALVKSGDMAAFGRLYVKHGKFVSHAIISTAPELDRATVEDLCHDTFISLKSKASRYTEQGKFKAWLFRYASLMAKERRRKRFVRYRLLGMFTGQGVAVSTTVPASQEVVTMLNNDVSKLLEKLPQKQRQILILFEKDGMKGEEIAELLELNVNTVWTHLRRARAAVNEWIRRNEAERGGR